MDEISEKIAEVIRVILEAHVCMHKCLCTRRYVSVKDDDPAAGGN